jgi:hypothetical protein
MDKLSNLDKLVLVYFAVSTCGSLVYLIWKKVWEGDE